MSVRIHSRLAASVQFIVLSDLAQIVLAAIWKPGIVQRFAPLGACSARDVILMRLRRDRAFLREGFGATLDEVLREMVAAGALSAEGEDLVLPILSGDKLKAPKAPEPELTPEEVAEAAEEERRRTNFLAAFRKHLRTLREQGDTRARDVILDEYRKTYRENAPRGHGRRAPSKVSPASPAEVPSGDGTSSVEVSSGVSSARPSLSSLSYENSSEREERENSEGHGEENGAGRELRTDRGPAEVLPAAKLSTELRETLAAEGVGQNVAKVTPAEVPRERDVTLQGGHGDGDPALPAPEDLSDGELGELGMAGLALAEGNLLGEVPRAEVEELGVFMREHALAPPRLATAGRFLRGVDVAARYAWDETTAKRGAVTLAFLLGKRVRGRREGERLLQLVSEGERAAEAARQTPGRAPRAAAAPPRERTAPPLSLSQQRALEMDARERAARPPIRLERPGLARRGDDVTSPEPDATGPGTVRADGGEAPASRRDAG